MKLSTLLKSVDVDMMVCGNGPENDPDILSIHYRAQDVRPGGLFVAIPGSTADGFEFIDEALFGGAVAVIAEKAVPHKTVSAVVKNARKALDRVSAEFYGHPSESLCVAGITGTNGKTTTAFLIESIFTHAGFSAGLIGTIICRYAGKTIDFPMTTPESADLQGTLADMAANGVTHVVMEASSHAIELFRVESCRFDVGVFTNLSQDHLDFHGDMPSYWACKKRLFTEILPRGGKRKQSVANCNDPKGKELANEISDVITAGFMTENQIRPVNFTHGLEGFSGTILTPNGPLEIRSALVGEYNLENILCAAGAGVALGISTEAVKAGIEAVESIPGRLERVMPDSRRFVYVDYAHTPDALENVLETLGKLARRRIICIFGCGGDRDRGKRSQMGEIACEYSDLAVITSDNPRSEPPMDIIHHVLAGTQKVCAHWYDPAELGNGFDQKGYVVQPDRKKAIRLGIAASQPDDVVLIAGKGHETYQIACGVRSLFDDREEAKKALMAIGDR